jgi:diguanylate cyclase (GGDEF)-like protein/PAS domain S-box-containing protein
MIAWNDTAKVLLDAVPLPVFYKNHQGIFTGCNSAFEKFFGLEAARLIGLKACDVDPSPLAIIYEETDRQLMEQGGVLNYEVTLPCADGSLREVVLHKASYHDPLSGKPGLVGTIFDITDRKQLARNHKDAELAIELLAFHDPLTRLPNKTLLKDRLSQSLVMARRSEQLVGVLYIDLDRFKEVNESLGHAVGDQLLTAVARRLDGAIRDSDTVARVGGDEFVVICPNVGAMGHALNIARKLMEVMAMPFEMAGHEIYCGISIGIAMAPSDGDSADELLRHASMAMSEARKQGRNLIQFYNDRMNQKSLERLTMESSMRKGLLHHEFFLVYHPQLDLKRGKITGMEALVRWHHPQLGVINPVDFIPLAEETGFIVPLGKWILHTACRQNRIWQDAGHPHLRVAVNISGHQFKHPGFLEMVDSTLAETGLAPENLELELTESVMMDNVDEAVRTMNALKERGIYLALDDFGTGYSSLSYLKHFPIDRIKIAQSFVCDITTDPDNAAIIETIIALARSLDLQLIAEGVETKEQLHSLQEKQCHEMQGFYFARPLGEREFSTYLSQGMGQEGLCLFGGMS